MQLENYSFQKLPFSDLFKTYIDDFSQLSDFYETNPFSDDAVAQRAGDFKFSGNRSKSVDLLKKINSKYNLHEAAEKNIDRLARPDALCIVTGQQLGVYGGPLFTVLKTVSTIHRACRMEQKLDRPVIPVFWLADEDHDYDEIRSLTVLEKDEPVTFSLPEKNGNLPPVADLTFNATLSELRTKLRESQYDTDFSADLWNLLNAHFKQDQRFDHALGGFITDLFSKYGLILAGSNHLSVKRELSTVMAQGIKQADSVRQALETQTAALAESFKQQVTLYDSNLFYLDKGSGRQKISRNGNGWKIDGQKEWKTDGLIEEIEEHPERFSPNVFMRPITQDYLLPTLGYMAGPGEVAYYGQMKKMYQELGLTMPVIFPRLSATLMEPPIARIIEEVPFEMHEFQHRIEDLESEFVDRTETTDIEAIFSDWLEKVEKESGKPTQDIAEIDPTLEAAAEKAVARFNNELNKLKGKVYRSVKSQEETQLKRIRRIQQHLFPDRSLQERTLASIYFMNLYGVDIWDRLLESLDEDEQFNSHKIVYL